MLSRSIGASSGEESPQSPEAGRRPGAQAAALSCAGHQHSIEGTHQLECFTRRRAALLRRKNVPARRVESSSGAAGLPAPWAP